MPLTAQTKSETDIFQFLFVYRVYQNCIIYQIGIIKNKNLLHKLLSNIL